jgi:hypothetical protein
MRASGAGEELLEDGGKGLGVSGGEAATTQPGEGLLPGSTVRTMNVPSRELSAEDLELIEFARAIVDANTDGEFGVHTMGAAVRGADGTMYGGINLYHFTGGPCAELVALGHAARRGLASSPPLGAVWTPEEGTRAFDPGLFES